jgi:hypothetical protein
VRQVIYGMDVGSHEPDPNIILSENASSSFGLEGFNSKDYMQSEVLAQIFLKLIFTDWTQKVRP